ncbi:NmrA family NAD(P)-binding protein [Spirosoma aerolatum]|uniref:NmrA family NAD(P)-binding protein n=1 Tax=Spirosoma aerolatum TaxID=1211326 RepID=UPI0009ACB336|nr:NmrA family NAD(P)-binding protein [Spirosoma aerolatum]
MNDKRKSAKPPIIVLGASGRVGRVVAHQLLKANVGVRAVARHVDKLTELAEQGAELWSGSLLDQAFMNRVFAGAKAAFVLTPGDTLSPDLHDEQRQYNEHIVEAIRVAGLTHVVFLSSWGAELADRKGTIYGCYLMETLLNRLPDLNVVHLRAVWFMDNFIYSIGLIKMAGINGLSINPDFAFPCIDSRDIGMVAAAYLKQLDFTGKTIHYLQRPRDYTMSEVTAILGASIGRPSLRYLKFPKAVMINGLKSTGTISANVAQLLAETNERINSTSVHGEPRTAHNTTPTTLDEFARQKFAPAYLEAPAASVLQKIQGAFLRIYLFIS